jgi:hypothetical protein
VRRALGKQPFVVVAGALAPAGVCVIAGGLREHWRVVYPLLVAREINQPFTIVHETPV